MEIFVHIKFLLRCLAVLNYAHPRAELIKWIIRVFIITLILFGSLAFARYEIFKTRAFDDYIEPTLALLSYIYFFTTYVTLLWKSTTIIDLLADLQILFDRGWFSLKKLPQNQVQISSTEMFN